MLHGRCLSQSPDWPLSAADRCLPHWHNRFWSATYVILFDSVTTSDVRCCPSDSMDHKTKKRKGMKSFLYSLFMMHCFFRICTGNRLERLKIIEVKKSALVINDRTLFFLLLNSVICNFIIMSTMVYSCWSVKKRLKEEKKRGNLSNVKGHKERGGSYLSFTDIQDNSQESNLVARTGRFFFFSPALREQPSSLILHFAKNFGTSCPSRT